MRRPVRWFVGAFLLVGGAWAVMTAFSSIKAEFDARERQAKREQIMADFNRCAGATMDQLWQDGPIEECQPKNTPKR